MTPEEEARLKKQMLAALREEQGEEWIQEHSKFLDAQWEWAKQLGMLDPSVDLDPEQPECPART